MESDAQQYVRNCEKCQKFSPIPRQPARDLTVLTSPWPFSQWGMDIVGPMPTAPGGRRFLIVATDYFTKWVEAEALAKIREVDVIKFVFNNIITRFGLPRTLITDNGTQFDGSKFKNFCSRYGIRNVYSTPAYPQSNGQAEKTNRTLLDSIKKRLDEAKGRWTEELPNVLWTYRTTPRKPTGETPFALAYGMEAVIPFEIGLPSIRTSSYEPDRNVEFITKELDLVEERRDHALIRLASYQQELKKYHDRRVKARRFEIGDFVLRRVLPNTRDPSDGKLGPNWEGPYKVVSVGGSGSYRLENTEGKPVKRAWNIANLRKFYH